MSASLFVYPRQSAEFVPLHLDDDVPGWDMELVGADLAHTLCPEISLDPDCADPAGIIRKDFLDVADRRQAA